jgi:hypothetical protein
VGDATQTIYDAVGEDNDANIIFGAVTDPTMTNKIQVTVIATGFNDEKLDVSSSRHSVQSFSTTFSKKQFLKDNKVEQMAINLNEVKVGAQKPKVKAAEKETTAVTNRKAKSVKKMEVITKSSSGSAPKDIKEREQTKEESKQGTDSYSPQYGMPMVVKKGNMKKEQIFVSKGQVISHYEDDMDIPTFLRKQMQ